MASSFSANADPPLESPVHMSNSGGHNSLSSIHATTSSIGGGEESLKTTSILEDISRHDSGTSRSTAPMMHSPFEQAQSVGPLDQAGLYTQRRQRSGSMGSVSTSSRGSVPQRRRRKGTSRVKEQSTPVEGRKFEVLSAVEHNKMYELFNKYDDDHDGSIHVGQLQSLLVDIGHPMDESQATDLLNQVDTNGNGMLEFDEFVQMLRIFKDIAQFRLYDGEADKVISRQSSAAYSSWLPDAHFRWIWDVLAFLSGLYIWIAVLSLHLARNEADYWRWGDKLIAPDIIVTFVIFAHLCIESVTPYFIGRDMVNDSESIVVHYFTQDWGIPVVISLLPMRLFSSNYMASLLLAHFRVLFTFQCNSLFRNSNRMLLTRGYINFHFTFVPFFRQFMYFLMIVHMAAVILFNLFDEEHTYSACVYVVMYIFAAVGYGNLELTGSSTLMVFGMTLCTLAMLINGLVIGSVVSFIQNADVENTRRGRLVETQAVLKFFDVPVSLQEEILQFQDHIMKKDVNFAYDYLVSHLPREIRSNLTMQFQMQLLTAVPLFHNAHYTVRIALCQALKPYVFTPENYITVAGEVGMEMFFINYGFVDILSASGIYEATLCALGCFGEMAVLSPHTGDDYHFDKSCKTLTYVEVMLLTRVKVDEILDAFPRFKLEVEEFQETIGVNLYVPDVDELEALPCEDAPTQVLSVTTTEGSISKKSGGQHNNNNRRQSSFEIPDDEFLNVLVNNGVDAVLDYMLNAMGIDDGSPGNSHLNLPAANLTEVRARRASFTFGAVPSLVATTQSDEFGPQYEQSTSNNEHHEGESRAEYDGVEEIHIDS